MADPLALNQCHVKFEAEPHYEYPRVLKHVNVEAIHPVLGRVGSLQALQINRKRCRGEFIIVMDEESQELCDFALALFDENGCFRPELVEHEYHKGTGVWGRELDNGMLLYVLSVRVNNERHRRNGIGTFLLQQLSESQYAPAGSYLIAWPSPEFQYKAQSEERWQNHKHIAVDFFQKNHFRRVGRTQFLACSVDPSHASRSLAVGEDVPEQKQAFDDQQPPSAAHSGGLDTLTEQNLANFLESTGTAPFDDPSCPLQVLIAVKRFGMPTIDVVKRIQDAYGRNPSMVREKDEEGNTALHVAAASHNLAAVQALLALPLESGILEDLTLRDNKNGFTPLEACDREMRRSKEFAQTLLGTWSGHPAHALRTQYVLKCASGENLGISEDDYVETRRWGCTCGACTDGWLSPRMRYRLLWSAQIGADNMMVATMGLTRGSGVPSYAPGIDYLPEDVQETRITKTFYGGYEAVVRAIADVLERPGLPGLPLPENVRSVQRLQMFDFVDRRGGKMEYALDYVVHGAMEQSPLGDSTFDDLQQECADEGSEESLTYMEMVPCANDLDFSRVAERLGLPSQGRYRSYGRHLLNSDDDMDEDVGEEDTDMDEDENDEYGP
ncbi:hypothetical protein L226DRAFT_480019 [Lentinus tigrinus ALCF2SS1-7]|uniref:Uncharacterized protein n=1 Tax=Lentinus tigrinus ALCF2SS1-6 TaxID=1328759 RepID=A0A5C2SNF3_9APHY|nr:hypothetical protein L227DRAFT_649494 [Lentinus tigrinus ALCF2SS1-6]RPD79216.1 hypothetical protein L226DRAFT_480019 [Lentinus tigrinus ALCF2SS1-7]